MKTFQVTYLIGRAGREPTMRYASTGKPYTTFSLATDRPGTKDDAGPDWHRIVCWDKLAEFVNAYVGKGRLLYVSGRLTYRDWTGKDGQPRRTAEILASEILLLDRPPAAEPAEAEDQAAVATEGDDDLPF